MRRGSKRSSTSSESYSAGTMDRLCMTDTPQLVTPTLLRERQLAESSLAYLPDFVDRLGYSNKFFEFIRLGWIAALIGGVLLIVWTCSVPDGVDLRRVLRAAAISAAAFLAVCAFAWGWSFLAVAKLDRAAERTAGGEYREARRELQRAAALFPVLNQDTYFVLQTGLVEDALGEATLAARLYRASVLEQSGCRYQADLVCAQLMAESPDGSAVRREACRSLLRSAIDEVNAGRNNEAMNGFEAILAVDPCNLKAVYGMQLACLRAGHYQRAVALARRIDATYVYFQFPSRQATQFLSHMLATAADYGMGDADAAVVEARKVLEQ
jgi:tetratricopeptide (TPR) repeat protein